eukprot:TRINITY_DN56622_c0_g1_i1.p1 TRINITY_DN56622_c0_g1~~TRINITY_DN56622_c0_g1_i1.p1  ORF type:complete len:753 (+),score=166.05 TRINITY_DN56622_c0_g1_i1:65-2260(+)
MVVTASLGGGKADLTGTAELPDWMGCDLGACRTLEEVSSQIVGNCRTFGSELQGVCVNAMKRLPRGESDEQSSFECADAALRFLAAFDGLSSALLALSDDLESAVTRPLQKAIVTLTEESTGRAKHLQQVRNKFADLQERYRKTRAKTAEAKGKLAGEKRWSWRKALSNDGKAASAQHAAVCDLAKCEEELLESEASLRQLEDDSRERLKQLDKEKQVILRGALFRGMSSLRRLHPVTDKVPAPEDLDILGHTLPFQGIMPGSTDATAAAAGEQQSERELGAGEGSGDQQGMDRFSMPDTEDAQLTIFPQQQDEAAAAANGSGSSLQDEDRSARYAAGASEFSLDVDDEEEEAGETETSAAMRAAGWSPEKKSFSARSRQRSLVFQSMGESLVKTESFSSPSAPSSKHDPQPDSSGPITPSISREPSGLITPSGSRKPSGPATPSSTSRIEEDSSDDSDGPVARKMPPPLEKPDVELKLSPLVAEQPQHCFERYVKRIPESLAAANEVTWDKIQARAAETPPGSYVGKLEMFWIHSSDSPPSADSADGLVCFQFVQGCVAHYARVLHISVVSSEDGVHGNSWQKVLPSAVLEVKRLIFGTLPVDSLRAVVLAAEDESTGRIYVNRDVELAYQQSRFRWFQLTQSLRRSRSGLSRRKKKLTSRFLILNTARTEADPPKPRSTMATKDPLLLQSEAASETEVAAAEAIHKSVMSAAKAAENEPAKHEMSFTSW